MSPETFVVFIILMALAGSRFYYWTVVSSMTYIMGIIIATELSKLWGIY